MVTKIFIVLQIKAVAKATRSRMICEASMDCIRRVHQGETCVAPALAAKLAERVSGETVSLREVDVLKLIGRGQEQQGNRHQLVYQRRDRKVSRQRYLLEVERDQQN